MIIDNNCSLQYDKSRIVWTRTDNHQCLHDELARENMFFVWCSHLHLFQGTMVSKSPRVPLITLVGICQDSVATCFRVWWFEFDFKSTPTPRYPLLILIIFTTVVPLAGYTTPIPPQNKRSIFCHDLCILMNNDFCGQLCWS